MPNFTVGEESSDKLDLYYKDWQKGKLVKRLGRSLSDTITKSTGQRETKAALKEALDEVKRTEDRLRKIIDTIPILAWCSRPDGSSEFLNRQWHDYTGLSPEEAQGW